MIWTHASGRPAADEDENVLRCAKWLENLQGSSAGVKILKVCLGSLNDRGIRRTANLHVFNQENLERRSG